MGGSSQCVCSVKHRVGIPWPERLLSCRPSWAPGTDAHMSRQVLACARDPSVMRQMHDSADHQALPPWPERLVTRFPDMTTTAAVPSDETASLMEDALHFQFLFESRAGLRRSIFPRWEPQHF